MIKMKLIYQKKKKIIVKMIIDELTKSEELIKFQEYDSLLAEKEQTKLNKDDFIPENDEVWEFIDDIEGVKELT